jgi:tetratricopeptide (TPR) repeat protein
MRSSMFVMLATATILSTAARAETLEEGLAKVQRDWAIANYETAAKARETAFGTLTGQAEKLVSAHADRVEPKVWLAIVLSSDAGVNGGLGALGKVKKARRLLEEAERIEPEALDGSVFTSLGSLYYRVPGWPIGFGDDDKAEAYLKKALAVNPDGIDPNYFYGDFLIDQGRPAEAIPYLEKARMAAPRPDREIADRGRHAEIESALAKARSLVDG